MSTIYLNFHKSQSQLVFFYLEFLPNMDSNIIIINITYPEIKSQLLLSKKDAASECVYYLATT